MLCVLRRGLLYALLALFLIGLASPSAAGPWPRKKGEGFLSASVDTKAKDGSDPFFSLYLEYGMSRGRTVGLERYQNDASISKSIAFLRWPIVRPTKTMRFAFELGAGIVDGHPALRPGISFGKGLEWGPNGGWFSMDTRTVIYENLNQSLFESDATFGWNLSDRFKSIVQLQAGVPLKQDPYLKLAPSFVFQHSEKRSFTIGLTAGVVNATDLKLNMGLWQNF